MADDEGKLVLYVEDDRVVFSDGPSSYDSDISQDPPSDNDIFEPADDDRCDDPDCPHCDQHYPHPPLEDSSSEEDMIYSAWRRKDDHFIDWHNDFFFPPGALLNLGKKKGYQPQTCPRHTCYKSTFKFKRNYASVETWYSPTIEPGQCDRAMTREEASTWVQILTDYPAYILFTYQEFDLQERLATRRGHLVRNLVPPHYIDAGHHLQMNLCTLAKKAGSERWQRLNYAVAPGYPFDHGLVLQMIDHMPTDQNCDEPYHLYPDSQWNVDLMSLYKHKTVQLIRDNNYTLIPHDSQRVQQRQKERLANANLRLVFDLVCVWLLNNPMFDNPDNGELKYEVISDYIPWTMISLYMDPALFTYHTRPWIQIHQFVAWHFLVKYNFWYKNGCFKQYECDNETETYWIEPQSNIPWPGQMGFYAGFFTPKLIFQADLRARAVRIYPTPFGYWKSSESDAE